MWGTFLSEPLPIIGLVGRYPTNYLIGRMPLRYLEHLTPIPCRIKVLWGVNPRFHGLYPGIRQVAYALLTRAPVAIKVLLPHDAPRLACVKPVASVHPEPGSNSS